MDSITEIRPEICSSMGLDCASCVERCASTTAVICPDLDAAGAHKMFFQLYAAPACHPMAHAFMHAYRDAASPRKKPMVAVARASAAAA